MATRRPRGRRRRQAGDAKSGEKAFHWLFRPTLRTRKCVVTASGKARRKAIRTKTRGLRDSHPGHHQPLVVHREFLRRDIAPAFGLGALRPTPVVASSIDNPAGEMRPDPRLDEARHRAVEHARVRARDDRDDGIGSPTRRPCATTSEAPESSLSDAACACRIRTVSVPINRRAAPDIGRPCRRHCAVAPEPSRRLGSRVGRILGVPPVAGARVRPVAFVCAPSQDRAETGDRAAGGRSAARTRPAGRDRGRVVPPA